MIKFSCEKVFRQSAIAVTSRAVAQKSSIPALEGLLIHADQQLTISGYNMQTGIRTNVFANVVEGGDIVLNARLFGDIIRRMPDDMITFTADEKMMVHVSCGDADFDILGLSAADYPDLPEVEDEYAVSMQQKVLRSMIEEVAFAVSTNESRPVHTGALFEIADMSLSMVAVDGFRLAFRREKLEKLLRGLREGDAAMVAGNLHNDLAFALYEKFPLLRMLRDTMKEAGALNAEITGSGPTLYAVCETVEIRRQVAQRVRERFAKETATVFENIPLSPIK